MRNPGRCDDWVRITDTNYTIFLPTFRSSFEYKVIDIDIYLFMSVPDGFFLFHEWKQEIYFHECQCSAMIENFVFLWSQMK